ncbi:TPA: Eae protein [Salmonella enterica subsp. enterica serovar Muenchen]|nr:Eae protein [Salmonella enterica subsp. enterica serovar Muenchen]HEC8851645.1 Eae protein [Salmonella enterica subsp. enterica serovar Muenchen]HEC9141349.1 Eae protein [Salmonella enterica subsp. enterica serovar Muenchen]HEC9955622.1 Eae protein [Salmonella enterica subsp. enterica serovar Muenchen]
MDGFLKGKCIPRDLKVNETNAEYLVRKFDEVRAEARNEGINYTASRLAAAFNHGFINKSLREVFDVTRMILSAKEDLANNPLPADDGLSGEYAEKAIEEWETQLRQEAAQ